MSGERFPSILRVDGITRITLNSSLVVRFINTSRITDTDGSRKTDDIPVHGDFFGQTAHHYLSHFKFALVKFTFPATFW